MSELITIDTGANLIQTERIEPLPLYDENHPMLKEKIPEYDGNLPNESMNTLIKRLKMTMKKFGGIGLSANQCGVFQRVFVIGTDNFQFACINPKVVNKSVEISKSNEGCLSFPGLFANIERPEWIEAEFLNENGETVRMRFEGLTARCYLHELDHMNGIVFTEHMGPVTLQMAKKKQKKIIKTIVRK